MPSTLPTLPLRGVENTLRQLLNDIKTVVEARCHIHGAGGGTTANSAAALLPLIAMDMLATRTSSNETRDDAFRRVFRELAAHTRYRPYETIGYALFKMLRHGLAHQFWSNEFKLANGPKCVFVTNFWIDANTQRSVCVYEIGDRADSKHLVRMTAGDDLIIQVSAQHLAADVCGFVEDFLTRLAADTTLQATVEQNETRIAAQSTARLSTELNEGDAINLGV